MSTNAWTYDSPIGPLLVTTTEYGIKSVDLHPEARADGKPEAKLLRAFDSYFAGKFDAFAKVPVDIDHLPDFRREVLGVLRNVHVGHTVTYGELAALVGRPRAPRAVGQAVGANPLAIVIPCHRVIAADGTLGGYSGGLDTKRALLGLEGYEAFAGGWHSRRAG